MGEWFPVFASEHTSTTPSRFAYGYEGVSQLSRYVALDTDRLPALPIHFVAIPAWKNRSHAITPFAPDQGYRINQEDFAANTRMAKLQSLTVRELPDIPDHPLLFGASTDEDELARLRLLEPRPQFHTLHQFRPAVWSVLRRLRLQLDCGGTRCVSGPDPVALQSGEVVFHGGFYPLDTGPLAVPSSYGGSLSEGLHLALPNNWHALQGIEARFVLADDDWQRSNP